MEKSSSVFDRVGQRIDAAIRKLLRKLPIKKNVIARDIQINYNPLVTHYIVRKQLLEDTDFFLIDVGASGGIAEYWNVFGKHLRGFGFDSLIKECERLNSTNTHSKFSYFPYFIISENEEIDRNIMITHEQNTSWHCRSSAVKMNQNQKINYIKKFFNQGEEVVVTDRKISLDRFCLNSGVKSVDFMKIDTDGFDYGVLKGAENLLNHENTLGVLVECDFNSPFHPHSNSFRNIDSFLAEKGFSLFDLSTWRYSRGDLPGIFVYKIPAQTISGQVCWGDALYLKDFVRLQKMGRQIPTIQVLKMACLQEIFGLPDCAAELLLNFRDQLSSVIDVDHCLDLLAKDMNLHSSYEQHMLEFRNHPEKFYPTR